MLARFDLSALSRRPSAKFVLALLTAGVVIMLVTFTARAWWTTRPIKIEATRDPGRGAVQQLAPPTPARLPIVLTNLTRFGFEPSKMTLPTGRYLVAVGNHSSFISINLQLARKAGPILISKP